MCVCVCVWCMYVCVISTGGVDYNTVSQVLTFDPLNPAQTFSLNTIDDEIFEDSEDFTLQLSLVTESERIDLFPDQLLVIINDNDLPPRELHNNILLSPLHHG